MAVYLSSATLGNDETLLTVGHGGELMAWFYPHKDHAQQIRESLPAIFIRDAHGGRAHLDMERRFYAHPNLSAANQLAAHRSRSATIGRAPHAARLRAARRRGFVAPHRSRKHGRYRIVRVIFSQRAIGTWAASPTATRCVSITTTVCFYKATAKLL